MNKKDFKINGVDFDPGKHLTVNTGNGGVKSVVKNIIHSISPFSAQSGRFLTPLL